MEGFPSGQREQTVNLPAPPSMVRIHPPPPFLYRGVEQLVARRAHNPKVVGSSPASATKKTVKTFVFTVFSLNRQGNLYPIFYMRRDPKNS